MEPETSSGELLKVIRGLAGPRGSKVLFWSIVVCAGVYFAPVLLEKIEQVAEGFGATGLTWELIAGSAVFLVLGTGFIGIAAVGLWVLGYALGMGFARGRRRRDREGDRP